VALFDTGSIAYQGTTVTNSATLVFSSSPNGTALTNPVNPVILNQGTALIYVGAGTVTTTGGVPVPPGQFLLVSGAPPASNLWAITAAGSSTVVAGLATVAAVV
jgi:hypothetical protein